MNFQLNDEQVMLQETVTRYLRESYSFDTRRARLAAGSDHDGELWSAFADTLGILGAALPEAVGGLGGGPVETLIIMQALGEALVIEPYLETVVVGAGVLRRCRNPRASELLQELTRGKVRIALAANEPAGRYDLSDIATTARQSQSRWVLDGFKSPVVGATAATHILVSARIQGARRDRDGIGLFLLDVGAAGVTAHGYRWIDGRPAADLQLKAVQVGAENQLESDTPVMDILDEVTCEGIAALCAEAVGVMRRVLSDTVAYTQQRRQFGQPLSAFQVLQHRMVDMYLLLEQAIAAMYLGTLRLNSPANIRNQASSAAKATISRCARLIGQSAVQLHGAMGLTEELAVGHCFKRLTAIEQQLGTESYHVARYAQLSRTGASQR